MDIKTMIIGHIYHQPNRVLFYESKTSSFHVIGDKLKDKDIKLGDIIAYKPYGVNFGFMVH